MLAETRANFGLMKTVCTMRILLVVLFASALRTKAQFYAPDTEYHDPVQRVYVVEAARVLAWWNDRDGTNVSEITYHVASGTNQTTVWDIRWLGQGGKELKSATISYGAEALKNGPNFYRSVFQKLWAGGWKSAPELTSSDLATGFWRGAAQMGVSREESLEAAFAIEKDLNKRPEKEWIPQLAGLLAHAALPGLGTKVSLDDFVLARSAAWLALAEVGARTNRDDLWTPVIYQAGRERTARELWQRRGPPDNPNEPVEQSAWNLWMRNPVSKDVFLFATVPAHLPMALPMISHDVDANGTGVIFGELFPKLVGSEKLERFHNYAPFISASSGVMGGNILRGQWPDIARRAWVRMLTAFPRANHDYNGYDSTLRTASAALARLPAEDLPDSSLNGLHAMSPLLRLAHEQGVGKLLPTGVVTARDLLNYGWEMAGLQVAGRLNFVAHSWYLPEMAQSMEKSITTDMDGVEPLFTNAAPDMRKFTADLTRLQMCSSSWAWTNTPEYSASGSRLENARLFLRRCWLDPNSFEWQARALRSNGADAEIVDLIDAFRAENTEKGCRDAMIYLSNRDAESLAKIPRAEELMKSLAEAAVEPNAFTVSALEKSTYHGMRNFDLAQTLERIYWKYPDSGLEYRIIWNYAVSGSFESALRFYREFRGSGDDLHFSYSIGEMLYMLCYVTGNEDLGSKVSDDCLGGSAEQMNVDVFATALHGDTNELAEVIRGRMARYNSPADKDDTDKLLLGFVPLLSGLSDPASPRHTQALDYFSTNTFAPTMQWLWIRRYKLSDADAIRFLGGPNATNAYIRVMVTYYQRNPRQNRIAEDQFMAGAAGPYQAVIGRYLFRDLHGNPQRHEDADLKPPVVETIAQAVRKKLGDSRR